MIQPVTSRAKRWLGHITPDPSTLSQHTISSNELDEPREMGLVQISKLMSAGVLTFRRSAYGTPLSAEIDIAGAIVPDVYGATIRDIRGFPPSWMRRLMPLATSQLTSCEKPYV